MRWRTEDEVLDRRGELTCGGVRCEHHRPAFEADDDAEEGEERPLVPVRLAAFQLDFAYEEDGQPQRALVKAILCDKCQGKLSYKRRRDARAAAGSAGDGRDERSDRSRRRSRSPSRRRELSHRSVPTRCIGD